MHSYAHNSQSHLTALNRWFSWITFTPNDALAWYGSYHFLFFLIFCISVEGSNSRFSLESLKWYYVSFSLSPSIPLMVKIVSQWSGNTCKVWVSSVLFLHGWHRSASSQLRTLLYNKQIIGVWHLHWTTSQDREYHLQSACSMIHSRLQLQCKRRSMKIRMKSVKSQFLLFFRSFFLHSWLWLPMSSLGRCERTPYFT